MRMRTIDQAHAELLAMRKACRLVGDWRLEDCTMYITLEPCQMCAGAIVQARIPRVVIGSMNAKAGCAGSVLNILEMDQFNHQCQVTRGVLEEECSSMLSAVWNPLGNGFLVVCSITRAPAKPTVAPGSARMMSPSIAKEAVTPPVVGSVSTAR